MVYSVLPMVNGTVVLSVIVRHGVGRLQVQMRFCYTNDRVLSHGVGRGLIFGPMDEAWACSRGHETPCGWAESPCRSGGLWLVRLRLWCDRDQAPASVGIGSGM